MLRKLAFVVGHALILVLSTTASVWAADFGTAEEAKAMLEKAVAAVKKDKAKALDMFNNGEGGFKDRDLYVWCANASDGIVTATPYWNRGKQLRDIEGKRGAPFGETVMQNATEGTIKKRPPTGGRGLAQTSRWRRLPYTRRSEIRFAVSATTRDRRQQTAPAHLPKSPASALTGTPETAEAAVGPSPLIGRDDVASSCSVMEFPNGRWDHGRSGRRRIAGTPLGHCGGSRSSLARHGSTAHRSNL